MSPLITFLRNLSQKFGNRVTLRKPIKRKKAKNLVILSLSLSVGITGLEPATSRPPDVCATNCAKSRSKYSVPMDSVCIAISRKRVQRYDDFLNLANFLVTF